MAVNVRYNPYTNDTFIGYTLHGSRPLKGAALVSIRPDGVFSSLTF